MRINGERLLRDLDELASIGGMPDGGVTRTALSEPDIDARRWFQRWAQVNGFEFEQDGAGNCLAVLRSTRQDAQTLLIGSHLDTVPAGGRFDGALGVAAALEVLHALKVSGVELPVHVAAISFTDEEGTLLGLLGSRAFSGQLTEQDLERPCGSVEALRAGLDRAGLSPMSILSAARNPNTLGGFLEVHIEQGTRLEEAGLKIGVVTTIVGIRSYRVEFTGQAAHAGTTPMDRRSDALWGATAFVQRARALVIGSFTPGVMNCGQIYAEPGAFNIVPGRASLLLELRHTTVEQLDQMEAALSDLAREVAAEFGTSVAIELVDSSAPTLVHNTIMQAIEDAARRLDLGYTRLTSFAGHDTQAMASITPSGMFFVPSVNGISHNPREFTKPEDVINAANVLLHSVLGLTVGTPMS